jgi:hypothetical protein
MALKEFLQSNKDAIAANAIGSTIGGLVITTLLYVVAVLLKGGPIVWQWTLRHPTVAFVPLAFTSGVLFGGLPSSLRYGSPAQLGAL